VTVLRSLGALHPHMETDQMDAAIESQNQAILARRQKALLEREGIEQGDFVIRHDGTICRVAHNWGDLVQLTGSRYSGSFYLGEYGVVEYSGGLEPGVSADLIEETFDFMEGDCWFFSQDIPRGGNAHYTRAQFKVFRLK